MRTPLVALIAILFLVSNADAWEGHDWKSWSAVTTWRKPVLRSDQAGRTNLVAILGEPDSRVSTPAAWKQRRSEISDIIQAVLGSPTGLQHPGVEVRETGVTPLPGYTRRHLRIRCEADDWIPAYLLVPNPPPTAPVPAMICQHQTVAQGKDEPCGVRGDPELAFAVELVKRGYVCLAPDMIGFGERIAPGKQPYDDSLAFYRRHPGWSFFGKMIWDVGRIVDYLETLPFVDAKRIGTIGHSHGAYGSLFASAFETRIAATVASCGFTTFRSDPHPERWSHLTALVPQLGFYLPDVAGIPFDWQHVLALSAPRRLHVWFTTADTIFPRTDNLDALLRDVQGVYRLQGRTNDLSWQFAEGPHRFPADRREAAYRWLDEGFGRSKPPTKTASAFYPGALVAHARANAREHAWAASIRDSLVAAAKPWFDMPDDQLWDLMFGPSLKRAWQVWSDGHCPSCRKPVPMYEWQADALNRPWKMRCPQCLELFPKNDFAAFHRSGLDARGVFDPRRANRSLLFNAEHPDPADPLHRFGVDDGDGYVDGTQRWRFINAYLIFGQWKQAVVEGIRNLTGAYVATGDLAYAHKAGVLLDRVADLYPTFDFGKEGVMYEGAPRSGYVSTWHDACVEVHALAIAYDAVFEGLQQDPTLVPFLASKAARYSVPYPKASFADVQRNIEERIFRDTLANRPKIESNYPATDVAVILLRTVLDWPGQRAEIMALLDAIIDKATAVDGLTGEKGIAGYSAIATRDVAELLGRYARGNLDFIREAVQRHPRLRDMFRFHIDTWCLGLYYPRSGDTGAFAMRDTRYAALPFSRNPGIGPSAFQFLHDLHQATGDLDFLRVLHHANGSSTDGLPFDLFARDPAALQTNVVRLLREHGADLRTRSVNKTEWGLAILRSGSGENARAAWLDYDSGERHGHADALTIGLFAKGLDLLPDFGYPPVQYGGWLAPRARWYTRTEAHNTVSVDGRDTRPGSGRTTLWFDGPQFHAVRASAPKLIGGSQFERTLLLVDMSDTDSYVVDILRVAGGQEHTRFSHGHFGQLAFAGLAPSPLPETRYGEVMRGFRRDAAPSPGWSATWNVEDHLKYLPPGREVRLRLTDLTPGAEVQLAESWVSVGLYGGTADAWIPSVLVRRHAPNAPLQSTFVSVLEPFGERPAVAEVLRRPLRGEKGTVLPDSAVGVEIVLADGRRDIVLARNIESGTADGEGLEAPRGPEFFGDLCLVRLDANRRPIRLLLCGGRHLEAYGLHVDNPDGTGNLEIDLTDPDSPRITGSPGNGFVMTLNGKRLRASPASPLP